MLRMELFLIVILIGVIRQTSGIMCSQCDSDIDGYCLNRPPPPQNCSVCTMFDAFTDECISYKEGEYCITETRYINETLFRITRDCSPAPLPETCEYISQYSSVVRVCFTTCKYNGCNMAARNAICLNLVQYFILTLVYLIICTWNFNYAIL